jgi:hypothetical protein
LSTSARCSEFRDTLRLRSSTLNCSTNIWKRR